MNDLSSIAGGFGDLSSLLSADDITFPTISLDLVDEDPDQPRTEDNPGFSASSLEGLAKSIKSRGIKTPISVRDNPNAQGRYIINHGARRYRASKLAGLSEIPYIVDNSYTDDDQVIENIQRDNLTPMEIAGYINKKVKTGMKKGEIADLIGKSAAYITQHLKLLQLPEHINEAFEQGRVTDVTVAYELASAYKKDPAKVESWMEGEQEFTRSTVKLLKEYIDGSRDTQLEDAEQVDAEQVDAEQVDAEATKRKNTCKEANPKKLKKAIVQISYNDRVGRILLDRRPSSDGSGWIKFDDDCEEMSVKLVDLQIISIIEG